MKPSLAFFDETLLFLSSLAIAGMILPEAVSSSGKKKTERAAEDQVCRELAADVLAGSLSRLDYMTTRCSARLLVGQEER